ncbi:EscC/YscC/HrcC family type III secretion system outer membrane ring protein [Roseateles aquatilis]|uniref:Type 3 secretion system secretin n=1 Tax=Roseateles aquatilis TaxID=431061 RepID=A0A246JLP9_9BURK|nr:type III secretion system outer membrane ring subunit SctC [Roseateles aquatilis]OWQ93566.1 EscC/YscC/HrcC family type III secretion system outer membrane ring protein [Roseateles aquatilis]
MSAHRLSSLAACRAVLCAAALAGPFGPATHDAVAVAPAGWRDTLYSYRSEQDLPLSQVLARFASTLGLELKLADPALGRRAVSLGGKGASPAEFLDRLADAQGLDWFVYQGVLHVSARSTAVSERLQLGTQSPSDAREALIGIGLLESRFGWGEFDGDPPTALVSGPQAYVALVRRALVIPASAGVRRERPQLMIFRLHYASASDREMRTRERSVTMPGLVSTLNQVLQSSQQANSAWREAAAFSKPDMGNSGRNRDDSWATLATQLMGGPDASSNGVPSGFAAANLPIPTGEAASAMARAGNPSGALFPAPATVDAAQVGRLMSGANRYGPDAKANTEFVPSIAAYAPLNAVLVWDLPSRREEYRAIIGELDIPSRLIEINVTILDVSVNALRDWSLEVEGGSGAARFAVSGGGNIGAGASPGTGVSGSTMALWASDRLQMRLRALESSGQAQVLSRPSVLTMDNVGALLDMNQSAYVKLVGERNSDLRTITAGTLLKVTPSIVGDTSDSSDERAGKDHGIRVTLDIEDGQLSANGADGAPPRVGNSAVSTEAVVRPGESLVIGGYRRQNQQTSNSRVPGLSSVPLIGALFRSDSTLSDERERLFILTARALP